MFYFIVIPPYRDSAKNILFFYFCVCVLLAVKLAVNFGCEIGAACAAGVLCFFVHNLRSTCPKQHFEFKNVNISTQKWQSTQEQI